MSWEVTPEAVAALEGTAARLEELSGAIHAETGKLRSVYEENESGLGYHSADIGQLLEYLESIEQEAKGPVLKLVLKLTRASAVRRAHIDNNPYGHGRSR